MLCKSISDIQVMSFLPKVQEVARRGCELSLCGQSAARKSQLESPDSQMVRFDNA